MPDERHGILVTAVGWRDVVPVLQPGWLCLCRCQVGAGKTSLALSLARDLAARRKALSVLFISLDVPVEDLALKLVTASTGIPFQALKDHALDARRHRIAERMQALIASWPLDLVQSCTMTVDDLIATIRRHHQATPGGMGAVIVDYIDLVSLAAPEASLAEARGPALAALKAVALELHIPILATAAMPDDAEEPADVDVLLELCLIDATAAGEQREVSLMLLRSPGGGTGGTRLVFEAQGMIHRDRRDEGMN